MGFPFIALWVPPTEGYTASYPWFLVPTIGILVISAGVLYWAGFTYGLRHVGNYAGKVFISERIPFFHREHGDLVQGAEVVRYRWVTRAEVSRQRDQ
jgi:hypothetical protein